VTMQTLSRRYLTSIDDLALLILNEFEEQPGLRLTRPQIRRLWNLSERTCSEVLAYLVSSRSLRLTADEQYCLPTNGMHRANRVGSTGEVARLDL